MLVFLALVMAAFTGDTPPSALDKLLDMLAWVITAFILFLADIAAGTTWLLTGGHGLYKAVLTLFFLGLLLLAGISIYITGRLIQHRPGKR